MRKRNLLLFCLLICLLVGSLALLFSYQQAKELDQSSDQPTATSTVTDIPQPTATLKPTDSPDEPSEPVSESDVCSNPQLKPNVERTSDSRLVNRANLQVGDVIAGWTVGDIVKGTRTGVSDPNAMVITFCGSPEVTGTFLYRKYTEYINNQIEFYPDLPSSQKFPIFADTSPAEPKSVIVHMHDEAQKKLGKPGVHGTARFTINKYSLRYTEVGTDGFYNTAEIAEVKQLVRDVGATLPDGTPIYENQEPVTWKSMQISLINQGDFAIQPRDAPIQVDVAHQFDVFATNLGIEVSKHEYVNQLNNDYAFVEFTSQAYSQPTYMLLQYLPGTNADYTKVYAMLITGASLTYADVKSNALELAKTWMPYLN